MQHRDQFRRRLRQQLRSLDRLPLQIEESRLDFRRAGRGFGNIENAGRQKWRAGKEVEHAGALNALADDVMAFIAAR